MRHRTASPELVTRRPINSINWNQQLVIIAPLQRENLSCTINGKLVENGTFTLADFAPDTGAKTRDLAVEQYLNGMDQHSTDHKGSFQ